LGIIEKVIDRMSQADSLAKKNFRDLLAEISSPGHESEETHLALLRQSAVGTSDVDLEDWARILADDLSSFKD
jgi:hypothetical protein